ncbi:hypothetical protein NC796_11245 [Aliifodinibius sp. S!AR15-10]|uniref:Cgl0159 family (beta/alpha)8-fold protein n=1 Tax=Aliifodinibius sp. S!AR15-10 TaxID=2950437 RepID=UPI00285E6C3E|nr:hypothetical protein [Aliifodinibius sp. S!AR15-10]MDR8391721.1 hypothetical protein [Aliifodinibius sp. S!AR15-10]
MKYFQKNKIIAPELFRKITDIRVKKPDKVVKIARKRKKSKQFASSGNINIVAADHPARGSVSVGDEPFAMADRHELLARLVYVLRSKWVDGLLGSMDLLEELLIIHSLMEKEGYGFLDEKLMIASMNRGGHPGAVWELNDPVTGADVETCKAMNLDAVKMLLRVDMNAEDSLKTLLACAEGVRGASNEGIPIILEPLPVKKVDGRYVVVKDADMLIELVSITSALGTTSRYTWLKLPFVEEFERVAGSTTLPIVILGGERSPDIRELLSELSKALNSGHQVRGAMYGRNVLFPSSADSLKLSEAIGRLVHRESNLEEILQTLNVEQQI